MIDTIIQFISTHGSDIIDMIAYTIAAASIIVKLTPTPKDDGVLASIIGILAKVGLNKEVPKK